jgi:hypothetical protein
MRTDAALGPMKDVSVLGHGVTTVRDCAVVSVRDVVGERFQGWGLEVVGAVIAAFVLTQPQVVPMRISCARKTA